jgi:hypothetical protein
MGLKAATASTGKPLKDSMLNSVFYLINSKCRMKKPVAKSPPPLPMDIGINSGELWGRVCIGKSSCFL